MTTHPPDLARIEFQEWRARAAADWVADDPHLQAICAARPGLLDAATAFGHTCANEIDTLARLTNRDAHLPRLERYDGQGNRIEQVDFHPGYHTIGRRVWGTGILSRYHTPGRELETLALLYLLAQNGEAGHACPLACTAGMIKILDGVEGVPPEWRERLMEANYDRRLHASQFLTEVQGGSDVGSNALVAREAGEGWWTLHGEKWFCSVIDAGLFLVTARAETAPPGTRGLRAFVVPREVAGAVNQFRIRRLKDKLGTRSMASAEVDFEGARALPVGDFRRTVEIVLNTSRLYNAVCAAAALQRAWREADAYARARRAFGERLIEFPGVARIVARLRVEAAAARALTFHLADLADALALGEASVSGPPAASPGARDAWRMLINLNKIWTALTCPQGVREAIEVMGGNGAIEEFSVLPRLLRDSLVMEAWEGGHGVLCAQLLRDARRGLADAMFDHLDGITTEADAEDLARLRTRWQRVVERRDAEVVMRDLVEEARPVIQGICLRRQGVPAVWITHLRTATSRGWDPLDDDGIMSRVVQILG